jgi:hypothetical protein
MKVHYVSSPEDKYTLCGRYDVGTVTRQSGLKGRDVAAPKVTTNKHETTCAACQKYLNEVQA